MKAIVISASDNNALGLVRSLGEGGLEVIFICEFGKGESSVVGHSKYVSKVHSISAWDEILEIFHRDYWREPQRIPVLCGSDATIRFLDNHYDELKDRFLIFNAGSRSRIVHFLDKYNTFPLASQAGIDLIPTWTVTGGSVIPESISYPCLVKGANSTMSSKRDMCICNSRQELERSLREGIEYLVQEYIAKDYELDVVGLSVRHGECVYIPAVVRKLRDDMRLQSGYIKLEDVANYPDLDLGALKRFVKLLGYEGIFSIELIYCKGKYYFLEINLRNDGVGYLYTRGGVNYPKLWAHYAAGLSIDSEISRIKLRAPIYRIQQRDIRNVFSGEVSLLKWLRQCLEADCYFYFNMHDCRPYIDAQLDYIKVCMHKAVKALWKLFSHAEQVGK